MFLILCSDRVGYADCTGVNTLSAQWWTLVITGFDSCLDKTVSLAVIAETFYSHCLHSVAGFGVSQGRPRHLSSLYIHVDAFPCRIGL